MKLVSNLHSELWTCSKGSIILSEDGALIANWNGQKEYSSLIENKKLATSVRSSVFLSCWLQSLCCYLAALDLRITDDVM